MSNPSDLEVAWLAGLLEGEGCFSLNRDRRPGNRRPSLVVKLKMTDADVVVRAGKLMNSPSVRRERDTRKEANSDCYVSRVTGAKAERVMRMVLPHMGTRRTEKINELLNTEGLSHR